MKKQLHLITHNIIKGTILLLVVLFASTGKNYAQTCQAGFLYSVDTTVQPNTVTMTDSSFVLVGTIINYSWNYAGTPVGTNTSTQTVPVFSFNPWDSLCLTITTDSGCVSTWCEHITTTPPCNGQAWFSSSHDSLGNYFFTASPSGFSPPLSYYWTASNGDSSILANFNTQFNVPGVYSVCLTVTDSNGCSDTYCMSYTVTANCLGCTPHFYYVQDSVNPSQFTFYDTTTYLATPTSDSWTVNGVVIGSGDTITTTLTAPPPPGASNYICRIVSVPGCDSTCVISCTSVIVPGVNISYFSFDSTAIHCVAPDSVLMFGWGSISGYSFGDTIPVHIDFNDGTDTVLSIPNQQTYVYFNIVHFYQNPGTYQPRLIIYSPDSLYSDTALLSQPIIISNTCGPVNGTVYRDNNQNCIYDSGDAPLQGRWVTITDGSSIVMHTYTDLNGAYSFNVPIGSTYTVKVDTGGNWYSGSFHSVCPVGASLTVTVVPSSNNNFYLSCANGFDLGASVSGWGFVPGRIGQICIYPRDKYCLSPNGQVQVILNSLVTPLPSSNYTIHGDTVTFAIAGSGYYYQSYCISVRTDTTASIGDSVCATVILEPVAGDVNPADNIVSKCWAVRTSWDPNDKSASPEGVGSSHTVLPGTDFTYTIRFQNTGNAPAQNIFILDTLDANVDVSTLEILASSHTMVPTLLTGNILRFSFSNINLPDSVNDEPNSHGYVTYRISPLSSVTNGAVIENTAGIYFDYNAPVITNTVFHTIDFFLSTNHTIGGNAKATVYPNPAKELIYVKLVKPERADVRLFDVTGRMVLSETLVDSRTLTVRHLPAGVYKVQIVQNQEVQNGTVIITR